MGSGEGTDQDQGRQLVTLAGGIVRHGVLDLLIGEREIIALAELVLVDIVGIHKDDRDAGVLLQLVAQFHRVRRVDQGDLLIAFKAGAEVEPVDAADAFAADFIEQAKNPSIPPTPLPQIL